MQKKRCKSKPKLKLKLKFGEYGISIKDEGRLEFVQLNFIKKSVKFVMRNSKHIYENIKKVWYNITANHVIQCKSKNSRMGKGKGLFERRIIRVQKNTILFEFTGISFFKLNFFVKKINKKLGIKTYLIKDRNLLFQTPTKKRFSTTYFNKYLKFN